jgi:hypothetical protein
VDRPHHNLLDQRQHSQKQEEDERLVQRWNDEREIFVSLANVKDASHQHELCAESGLDDSQAQVSVRDTLRLQNCRFEVDYCREAYVEVDRIGSPAPSAVSFIPRGLRMSSSIARLNPFGDNALITAVRRSNSDPLY